MITLDVTIDAQMKAKLEKARETIRSIEETRQFLQDVGDEETLAKVRELLDQTNKTLELILEKYLDDMKKV